MAIAGYSATPHGVAASIVADHDRALIITTGIRKVVV
jgi:hypothetical protein